MAGLITTIEDIFSIDDDAIKEIYKIYTFVDITQTNVYNTIPDQSFPFKYSNKMYWDLDDYIKARNQQSNFETLIQAISLRSNPIYIQTPQIIHDTSFLNKKFKKKTNVWYFCFATEQEGLFQKNNDSVFFLKEDVNNIPIIDNLDETIKFKKKTWETFNNPNIVFICTHITRP